MQPAPKTDVLSLKSGGTLIFILMFAALAAGVWASYDFNHRFGANNHYHVTRAP